MTCETVTARHTDPNRPAPSLCEAIERHPAGCDCYFDTPAPAAIVVTWTLVSRPKRGRYFRPVGGMRTDLTWTQARNVGDAMSAAGLGLDADIWLVPTREAEATDYVCADDKGNVMVHNGKRLPIRWDAAADVWCPPYLATGEFTGDDVLSGKVRRSREFIEHVVANHATVPDGIVTEAEAEKIATRTGLSRAMVAARVCAEVRAEVAADAVADGMAAAADMAEFYASSAGTFVSVHHRGIRARDTYRSRLWAALAAAMPGALTAAA